MARGSTVWRRRNGGFSLMQCLFNVRGACVASLAWRELASEEHVLGLVSTESECSGEQARYICNPPREVRGRAGTWEHRPGAEGTAPSCLCSVFR